MNALDRYLTENDLTNAEFGVRIGVTGEAVRLYRTGQRHPKPEHMVEIIRETGGRVSAASFLPGADEDQADVA
jgi:hypothetical protein